MLLKSDKERSLRLRKLGSLRLRLVLWYGGFLTVILILFVILVLILVTTAIGQSVDDTVRSESRLARTEVYKELLTTAPYWPTHLLLPAVNEYRNPGVFIQVMDTNGTVFYHSPSLLIGGNAVVMARSNASVWYTTRADGEAVRVESSPIFAPVQISDGTVKVDQQVIIGTVLAAKSLKDVNSLLLVLRLLLTIIGVTMLATALLGGWSIATGVLKPLADIAHVARSIASQTARGTRIGDLRQRVTSYNGRDEMSQVVEAFNEMLESLEKATNVQRRFVADASHELRVPLTTVQGNLAFLQRHSDEVQSEERKMMLSDAYEETLRLSRLVEELLLLARADASIDENVLAPAENIVEAVAGKAVAVELDHAVLQLVRHLRGRMRVEGSTLRLEVGYIEPLRVFGNEESIRRVLLILLDNAIKYSSLKETDAQEPPHITVSLERVEHEAVVHVRDTGIGISQEDLGHIFERFYRADRARQSQGTGLGLSIAETIMSRLGGRISVESTLGEGSTFSIWLPLVE